MLAPWEGAKFKCYDFVIDLQLRSVLNQASLPADSLPIKVTPQGGSHTYGQLGDHPLRERPGDFRRNTHGEWDLTEANRTWSHELGHVLGLDEGYVRTRVNGELVEYPQPGHTPDVMMLNGLAVSAQTITRIVRRSGEVDEAQIRCPLTLDTTSASSFLVLMSISELRLHAWTCDYAPPSDDPGTPPRVATFEGDLTFQGGYLADLHGTDWSAARTLVGFMTGVNTAPLAREHAAQQRVRFELSLDRTPLQRPQTPAREIWSPFRIEFEGGVLTGEFRWDEKNGAPVFKGPLALGGWDTSEWIPGPPLTAQATHGARECP